MAGSEHEAVGGADDRVAITAGGVHVNKWVAEGGSSVPIIKYELASTRDDDVRVALTDRIPEHLGLDDFGFHDEFHGESWNHVDDHEIRFETELGAEETLTTVYGVRRDAISDPDEFLGRPEISISASTNSSGAAGSAADDGADGTDDDEGAGSADSEASGDGRSDDAGVPTLSLPDPSSEQYDGEDGVDGALVEAGGDADGGSVLDLDDSDAEDSGGTAPTTTRRTTTVRTRSRNRRRSSRRTRRRTRTTRTTRPTRTTPTATHRRKTRRRPERPRTTSWSDSSPRSSPTNWTRRRGPPSAAS